MNTDGLRGAALALTGVAAHLVAEATGSEKAAQVESWVADKFEDDDN